MPDDKPPPTTYGEMRRRLAELGNPWSIDPTISDDEKIPQYPTGGAPIGNLEVRRIEPGMNIREIIAEHPPTDPGLRARWAEAKMPLDHVMREGTADRMHQGAVPEQAPKERKRRNRSVREN